MRKFNISVNGKTYEVDVEEIRDGVPVATPAPAAAPAAPAAAPAPAAPAPAAAPSASVPAGASKVEAPMPGTVLNILVSEGDTVAEGQTVVVLEAMKMENEIAATKAGKVASINAAKGQSVNTGDVLITIA